MEISTVVSLLDARVVCGHQRLSEPLRAAFASDLMSDVLTLDTDGLVLITGMCNTQTIRTAEMSDIACVLLVRGKKATPDMVALACENNLVMLECAYSMYRTVGILYTHGLAPVY
ncbi:DRTGG domain-containing protein [Breznakibacter xylanolyticus]|uniref:DRTGG domain-containing protein n=1 Tax=Breznakibacter xylanolyticus TaxID=990 RepID=A0A2W7P461_9BACT|nr:DRTGG domain-containing protein [Breznakibacter xylanolyticus]PZX18192.1 DRTGG domain-containing protein [Breznakibacter xylanolyticus]